MKNRIALITYILLAFSVCFSQQKRDINFNDNWRFLKDSTIDASETKYNDSKWRLLDLPHDWSIEDLPNQDGQSISGPFDRKSIAQGATGFTVGGIGWYRKKFITDKSFRDRIVMIHFDGVYMNSDVWLNGHLLGNHPYGYTPFYYDLTAYLNPEGKENVIVVRTKNEGQNSRWYSGSGIYRDVWLSMTNKIFINPWGIQVLTPEVNTNKSTIEINTEINNSTEQKKTLAITQTIISPSKKVVAKSNATLQMDNGLTIKNNEKLEVQNPELWSIENPLLYTLITEIKENTKVIDRIETRFGIRSISVSPENGFQINGKRVLIKGGCIHHDNGPLGAVVYYRAEERKIEILKQNGFNAVRTSHNPPSAKLLEACDRLGMLVIDEAFDMWQKPKNPKDYHLFFDDNWKQDLDAMILRDRNHPSVVFWSIGNEIKERVDSSGLRTTKMLAERARELDPSRPVTEALCTFWDNPGYQWKQTEPAYALLDVGGYNYLNTQYENDHRDFPLRIMLGTESFPKYALENWNMVETHPYVMGDFVWTAFDYIGEASIGNMKYEKPAKMNMSLGWPFYNGFCGDLDLIGNKKPQSYYRDVVWRRTLISMAVHAPIPDGLSESVSLWGWPDEMQSWTWPDAVGKNLHVRVFSRTPLVRLFLNDKLIAEKAIVPNSITAIFDVPYEPGTLKAINIVDGKNTDSVEFKTAGAPTKIRLKADRSLISRDKDLSYVIVQVVDAKGEIVPNAVIPINFSVTGAGTIAAVGNGSPNDVSSFQSSTKKTWRGQCLAILRSNKKAGTIKLTATSNGISAAQIVITTK